MRTGFQALKGGIIIGQSQLQNVLGWSFVSGCDR